jgi:hypothetical protein
MVQKIYSDGMYNMYSFALLFLRESVGKMSSWILIYCLLFFNLLSEELFQLFYITYFVVKKYCSWSGWK